MRALLPPCVSWRGKDADADAEADADADGHENVEASREHSVLECPCFRCQRFMEEDSEGEGHSTYSDFRPGVVMREQLKNVIASQLNRRRQAENQVHTRQHRTKNNSSSAFR